MLSPESKVTPNPKVVFTELEDGQVVLLHMDSRQIFHLNETGAQIWSGFEDGKTAGEISRALEQAYDVSQKRALKSVITLIETLAEQNLVSIPGETPGERRSP